ncbi:hypothetical protein SAICODRAFT_7469 [Saitoella complicata NRRL Y-17804]|nr:uncharacterized protein SAICODRAFT_7469 [Saitoella complicata NRRL Y-17804]ODQ52861.1 hypothetical protein SAICODRAFT_7469 [Saitoella complicata NRRL Y-17804]
MSSLAQFGTNHIAKGIGRLTTHVLERGSGSYVYTTEGKKLLDFTMGIGVTNLGHCHPKVTKAAQDQVGKLVHGQVNIAFQEPQLRLIEKLLPIMPDKSLDTFFFWNSGSEAVEASVKLARQATGRQNIIVMQGSYHGRTMGTMAMTRSKTVYSAGFHPLIPGVYASPFPYTHQFHNGNAQDCSDNAIKELEIMLLTQTAPKDTAAIIIETVLGEGGYVPPPPDFLKRVREICDKHGILLILDEVQSGFGRTGKMFAVEHYGVRPDVMVMAKGIANGFPISGIVSRKELMDLQPPGSMGGTYAGNAVACAAGLAVLDAFKEEKVLDNVAARSKQLFDCLHGLQKSEKTGHLIGDVRGLGLMVALEFGGGSKGDNIGGKIGSRVQNKCVEKGMLVLTTSIYDTLRFIPNLLISEEEMSEACEIITESVEEVAREG